MDQKAPGDPRGFLFYDAGMRLDFTLRDGVLHAEIRGRETAEETRALADATFAEIERTGARAVLMRIRDSRTIFKVEQYGLTGILERIAAVPGLRIAAVAEDAALHSAHQYIEVLARQRNVAYRAFSREAEALDWLQKGVRNLFPGKGS